MDPQELWLKQTISADTMRRLTASDIDTGRRRPHARHMHVGPVDER